MLPFPVDAHPPLHGVRVLDASRVLAGPFCGQLLGDLGRRGDQARTPRRRRRHPRLGPALLDGPDLSALLPLVQPQQAVVTLDLARPEGSELFHELLAKSDVLLENFRADSAEKLGLTPETLLARHPRLIVCSISGFGRTGPLKDAPGYDFAIQAMSGLMSITGPAGGTAVQGRRRASPTC